MTFEQAIGRLDEIVKALESGEGSLDQAMKLFEEGSKLADSCSAMLDEAEQKVTKLISADSGEEVPFEVED
jgi:exodeoxyribonuclease VII small subunit